MWKKMFPIVKVNLHFFRPLANGAGYSTLHRILPLLQKKIPVCKLQGPRPGCLGSHWHEDYFELKSHQNPADSGKALYLPYNSLERIQIEDLLQEESYHHRELHFTMHQVWQVERNLARPRHMKLNFTFSCYSILCQCDS